MPRPARLALHACAIVVIGLVAYLLGTSGPRGVAALVVIVGAALFLAIVGASRRAKSEGPGQP
ncbi:MAG: hypothetical protein PIR53_00710 [Nocardioides alkalitolerans]